MSMLWLAQLLGHLGKIGSNLNQIARHMNEGGKPEMAELRRALDAVHEIYGATMEAMGRKP